jgi:hypothetical protein
MKNSLALLVIAAGLAAPAVARNTTYMLPLAEVLESPEGKGRLDPSVNFYFGEFLLRRQNECPTALSRRGST